MTVITISELRCRVLRISDRTEWTVLEVTCSDGITGLGEASVGKAGQILRAHTDELSKTLVGQPALPATVQAIPFDGLCQRAVISALEQALWDALGHRLGVPVHTLLGGACRDRIPVYANINRRTRDRSAEGFAASARAASAAGYTHVKLAPFDGVGANARLDQDRLIDAGFERIVAVCDVMPAGSRVLVDCHWRFDEAGAFQVLERGLDLRLFWLECLLPETPEYFPALRRLGEWASQKGMRLAGLEMLLTPAQFAPHIADGHYHVIMPDVKYVGGITATLNAAILAGSAGMMTAPHNPSGPICHAASMAASAAIPNLLALEVQFDESPCFAALTGREIEVTDGHLAITDRPGFGVTLDQAVVAEVEVTR